jgi:MHS family proline/betaine transporter-like MFS transporter
MSAYNGLLIAHMPTYLASDALGYTDLQATQAQNLCLIVISILLPMFAWLGDKVPRRLILGIGSLVVATMAYPYYQALVGHSMNLYLLVVVWGAAASTFLGTFAAIAADLFPTRVRFSGVAVSMNVSVSVFSGTAPLIATALIRGTGNPAAPALYLIPVLLLAFAASFAVKKYGGEILGDVAALDAAEAEKLVPAKA